MSICQLGMHKNVQDHTNANVCKQTYDASCTLHNRGSQLTIVATSSSTACYILHFTCFLIDSKKELTCSATWVVTKKEKKSYTVRRHNNSL